MTRTVSTVPIHERYRVLPLSDVSVLEFGTMVAGPYCSRLLADSGADVIKVEALAGDTARRRGPFPNDIPDPDRSGLYLYLNANKRCVTVNLESSRGKKIFHELLENTDVLVENNRPSDMERLELDFDSLHQQYPRLIVTSVTPFGQSGPYRNYLGDDLIGYNMGGLAYVTPGYPDEVNDPDNEPPLKPSTYVADFTAGVSGAVATMLALLARQRDDTGRHVDISEQESVASMLVRELAIPSYLGLDRIRGERIGVGLMPNTYLPCRDGYIVLAAFTKDHWAHLVDLMGNPEWAETPLFQDAIARGDNWDGLKLLLLEWTMGLTGQEIYALTQPRGLPCFPAIEISQAAVSASNSGRGFLQRVELGTLGQAQMPGPPTRFGKEAWPLRRQAPSLGQHTVEIITEHLGYDIQTVIHLRELGVI